MTPRDDPALELVPADNRSPPLFQAIAGTEADLLDLVEIDNVLGTAGLDTGWLHRDDSSTGPDSRWSNR